MIYLHKLLPYMLYPITLIIGLLIWALVVKKRLPVLLALIIFFVTSSPIVSKQMLVYLEGDELRKIPSDMALSDSIVVLSGMIEPIKAKHGLVYEWADPDRFFGGVELMKAGKAKNIIFTGGKLPWQTNDVKSEGEILARLAQDFGISAANIIVTRDIQNTSDEALAVKSILNQKNQKKIILVTSAFHMARAKKLFENEGIEVQSYPVDFKNGFAERTPMDFLPSAGAFSRFQFSLRELLGRLYYRI